MLHCSCMPGAARCLPCKIAQPILAPAWPLLHCLFWAAHVQVTTYKICTIRLTDMPTAMPQAPTTSQVMTEHTAAGAVEASESNVQRLNESLARGVPQALEKNDSAKVSQVSSAVEEQHGQAGNGSDIISTGLT